MPLNLKYKCSKFIQMKNRITKVQPSSVSKGIAKPLVVGSGGLSFDEFKAFIHSIEAPAQRLGIFRLQIKNRGKEYDFDRLKETATFNEDNCGFSLNHYGWMNLPKQNYKRSKFHDEEDVCIDIDRAEFVKANKVPDNNEIILEMKNWYAIVSW